jgi:sodium/potassium/calcium exchanger 6
MAIPTGTCAISSALAHPPALLDYAAIHSCLLRGDARLSLPLLALLLLLHFRLLAAAASARFTPAVSRLAARLRLSPSMAAVTLLALGNGAPDAFASAAALAAILSAGAFVSAFVVGAVALIAAPFAVPPASFARDVFFYLVAASGLFYVYLSAEIFLWQAVGLVLFYAFFVGLVFYMDLGSAEGKAVSAAAAELEMVSGRGRVPVDLPITVEDRRQQQQPALCALLWKVCIQFNNAYLSESLLMSNVLVLDEDINPSLFGAVCRFNSLT